MHNNITSTEAVPGHIDERLKLAPENKRWKAWDHFSKINDTVEQPS